MMRFSSTGASVSSAHQQGGVSVAAAQLLAAKRWRRRAESTAAKQRARAMDAANSLAAAGAAAAPAGDGGVDHDTAMPDVAEHARRRALGGANPALAARRKSASSADVLSLGGKGRTAPRKPSPLSLGSHSGDAKEARPSPRGEGRSSPRMPKPPSLGQIRDSQRSVGADQQGSGNFDRSTVYHVLKMTSSFASSIRRLDEAIVAHDADQVLHNLVDREPSTTPGREEAGVEEGELDVELELAALLVEDAMAERPLRMHSTEDNALRAYRLYYNKWVRAVVVVVSMVHLMLALLEPTARDGEEYYTSIADRGEEPPDATRSGLGRTLLEVELAIVLVYALDAAVKTYSIGWRHVFDIEALFASDSMFKAEKWDIFRMLLVLVFFIEVVVALSIDVAWRPARILRPLVFLSYQKEMRRWVSVCVKMLPKVAEMLLFIILVVGVYAVVGNLLFGKAHFYEGVELENFDTLGSSFLAMFVLLSSENYPDIMWPSFMSTKSEGATWYGLYFFSFLLVGLFCLSNLLVPILYQAFKMHRQRLAVKNHLRERRALLTAFQLLDTDHNGLLGIRRFKDLVLRLRSDLAGKQEDNFVRLIVQQMRQCSEEFDSDDDVDDDNDDGSEALSDTEADVTSPTVKGDERTEAAASATPTTAGDTGMASPKANPLYSDGSSPRPAAAPSSERAAPRTPSGEHGASTRDVTGLAASPKSLHSSPSSKKNALPSLQGKVTAATADMNDTLRRMRSVHSRRLSSTSLSIGLTVFEFFELRSAISLDFELVRPLTSAEAWRIRILNSHHFAVASCFVRLVTFAVAGSTWVSEAETVIRPLAAVLLFVGIAEVCINIAGRGIKRFYNDFSLVLDGGIVFAALAAWVWSVASGDDAKLHVHELWLMVLATRTLLVLNLLPRFKRTLMVIVSIRRFMITSLVLMVLLCYSWAIVAEDSFAGRLSTIEYSYRGDPRSWSQRQQDEAAQVAEADGEGGAARNLAEWGDPCSGAINFEACQQMSAALEEAVEENARLRQQLGGPSVGEGRSIRILGEVASDEEPDFVDPFASFDDFASSMRSLFQISTTASWHTVMYTVVWGTGSAFAASLFFVLFYVLAVLFVLNLVVAIYIDAAEQSLNKLHETSEEIVIGDLDQFKGDEEAAAAAAHNTPEADGEADGHVYRVRADTSLALAASLLPSGKSKRFSGTRLSNVTELSSDTSAHSTGRTAAPGSAGSGDDASAPAGARSGARDGSDGSDHEVVEVSSEQGLGV